MFDSDGKLIGINGRRGSFEKRGTCQRRRRLCDFDQPNQALHWPLEERPHGRPRLARRNGLDGRQAPVSSSTTFLDDSDAYRRGLRYGDELIRFAGREIAFDKRFQNALGTFPNDWRVPLTYRRDGKEH